MDIDGCKEQLKFFRVRELRDVLTQFGLPKPGRKQDMLDKILVALHESSGISQCTKMKEELVAIINDIYRKMVEKGVVTSATRRQNIACSSSLKHPREVSCLCGHSILTKLKTVQCANKGCSSRRHECCVYLSEQLVVQGPKWQFICELCLIDQADPFWNTISYMVEPVKLEFSASGPIKGSKPFQFVQKEFCLDRANQDLIAKEDYALQAWCVLLADSVPFRIHWPLDAELFVNGNPVRTYNRPGSHKLGTHGRDDGVRITLDITKGVNKISLSCNDDRNFCFGVRLVKRLTVQEVLSMIPDESVGESFEDAVARIQRCIGGGIAPGSEDDCDIEVVTDLVTFCLRCPMSGLRMKTAGRFKPCVHMGCFDLEAFVQLNERSRKWQCPICLKNYSLMDLIIDPYFNRITSMMRNCGEEVTEIELKRDGSWRVKKVLSTGDLAKWHCSSGSLVLDDRSLKSSMNDGFEGVSTLEHGLDNTKLENAAVEWLTHRENQPKNVDLEVIEMSSSASGDVQDDARMSVNKLCDDAAGNQSDDEVEVISVHPPDGKRHKSGNRNMETEVVILVDSDDDEASRLPCPQSFSVAPSYCNGLPSSHPQGTSHILDLSISEDLLPSVKSTNTGNQIPTQIGRNEHSNCRAASVIVSRARSTQQIGRKRSGVDFAIPRGPRSARCQRRQANANIVRFISKRL